MNKSELNTIQEVQSLKGYNDLCIIALLKLIDKRDYRKEKQLKKLLKVYPTCSRFDDLIYSYLSTLGYIEYINSGAIEVNEFGQEIYIEKPKCEITKEGMQALRGKYFTSEVSKAKKEILGFRLSNYSIVVAIVGGLLGIIAFFKECFISLFNYFIK